MAEVRLEIDVAHPPERVWRALTDARLLCEWFMRTDLEPRVGDRFTLDPGELDGFIGPVSGELTELAAPWRMVMLWQGERLHTRVLWEVAQTADGCQVRVVQSGFIGAPANLRRRALRATYTRLFGEQLPSVLDRLATGTVGYAVRAETGADPARADDGGADDGGADSNEAASSLRTAVPRQRRRAPVSATAVAGPGQAEPAPTGGPAADPWPGGPATSSGVVMPAARVPPPRAPAEQTDPQPASAAARSLDLPVDLSPEPSPELSPDPSAEPGLEPVPAEAADAGHGGRGRRAVGGLPVRWRHRLAVIPAWGRALAIGSAAAVLAAAVMTGISQTWAPRLDPDSHPAQDGGREGPGLAAQPGVGSSRATDAGDPSGSTGAAPGAGHDGSLDGAPGAAATGGAGAAPAGPATPSQPGAGDPGAPETAPVPGGPEPSPELTAAMTTSGLPLLGGRAVSVTVSNPGPGPVTTWEVTVDVGDQDVTDVSGAVYERDGTRAIFTATADLAAGDIAQLTFDVRAPVLGVLGASDPTDCTIDGRPCG